MKKLILFISFILTTCFTFSALGLGRGWEGEYQGQVTTLTREICDLTVKVEYKQDLSKKEDELNITASTPPLTTDVKCGNSYFPTSWFSLQFKVDRAYDTLILSDKAGSYKCGYINDVRISCRERNGEKTIEFLLSELNEYGFNYTLQGPFSFNGFLKKK